MLLLVAFTYLFPNCVRDWKLSRVSINFMSAISFEIAEAISAEKKSCMRSLLLCIDYLLGIIIIERESTQQRLSSPLHNRTTHHSIPENKMLSSQILLRFIIMASTKSSRGGSNSDIQQNIRLRICRNKNENKEEKKRNCLH